MRVEPLEIEDLLGAYALDAVSSDERVIVESYLNRNPRARAEVLEHREVATMLAYSGAPAPEGLWDRIAGSLEEPAPAPGPELAKVLPLSSARRRSGRGVVMIAAGLAAAAAIGVVATRSLSSDPDSGSLTAAAAEARNDRDSRVASLVAETSDVTVDAVIDQDGHGYLSAGTLPALPSDETYQLWGVLDGEVISLGVLGNRPEVESFTATSELTTLVLTVEAAGGVVSSEQPAAFAGELA